MSESFDNLTEGGGPPMPIFQMRQAKLVRYFTAEQELSDVSQKKDSSESSEFLEPLSSTPKTHQEVEDSCKQKNQNGRTRSRSIDQSMWNNIASANAGDARERPVDGKWPEREALSFTRSLVFYGTGAVTEEHEEACRYILEARQLRMKYIGHQGTETAISTAQDLGSFIKYRFDQNGVAIIYDERDSGINLIQVPNLQEFVNDYKRMEYICSDGAMRSFCFQRLQMLDSAFKMHVIANGTVENEAQSNLLGNDFYNTMKIDNHIHLAAAASANQFVKFVGEKLEKEGDTVVMENGQTLKEVFDSAGISADHLTIDAFNVLADYSVFQRFDNFNEKYSPFRLAQIRKIFLKVENVLEGRYFAELTKIVCKRLEQSRGHKSAAEMRLSIYGMERDEWLKLARCVLRDWQGDNPGPVLSTHNRWLVQVPRLWRIYKMKDSDGSRSFQDMMENLFAPIFEATLNPQDHPEIAELLIHIVGFDSVDDEGASEAPCTTCCPGSWTTEQNPAYCWQLYHIWANLEVLNALRKAKGLNTFAFRPHAGETGDSMHLAATYLLADSINHGINLQSQVSLQYLYYLDQIGLSVAPLSNNFLFRKIASNPFPKLFKRGLNVTLSTDDPLLFHMSNDALLEEYSVARASFDLSMTDISEIARNSVLQSGFEDKLKKEWLGDEYQRGITFCDERKTHVPLIRAKFRAEHLAIEHMMVHLIAEGKGKDVLKQMMVHFGLARDAHRNILFEHLPDSSFPEQNQL
jgi:AMP deaminase